MIKLESRGNVLRKITVKGNQIYNNSFEALSPSTQEVPSWHFKMKGSCAIIHFERQAPALTERPAGA